MVSLYPNDLKYTKEHEWVKEDGELLFVGITHHAQDKLGDVVFVELPKVGSEFKQAQEFGVVESVKTVSSLFCPVAGKVVEVNGELEGKPELINEDPYGKGWIMKLKASDPSQLKSLLSSGQYLKEIKE